MGWFSKISGVLSFVLQALVVICGVLLFSYLDLFGWFNSKKKTLENTPVTISSIQEIGQLISAEYYGEVIASLNEEYIEELDDNVTHLKRMDTLVADALSDIRGSGIAFKRKKSLLDYFNEHYSYITADVYYQYYIDYMCSLRHISNEKNLLEKLNKDNYAPALQNISKDYLSKKIRDLFSPDKKSLKRQIIMIGRGTVTAGFDFGSFTETNFKYNASTNVVYFIGIHPEILSCHINPWLIPEKKVKGFEILVCTGKAAKQQYIQIVKQSCLDKLRESALNQQILEKAQINARETLKSFFTLLLNKPINNVVFLNSLTDYYQLELTVDGMLSDGELTLLDGLYQRLQNNTFGDTAGIHKFIDSLETLPVYVDHKKRPALNVFSSLEYTMNKDWAIDSLEFQKLLYLQTVLRSNKPAPEWLLYQHIYTLNADTLRMQYVRTLDFLASNTNQLTVTSAMRSTDTAFIRLKLNKLKP
ncbi:MAG: DUF4230 domain-containing protein [Cytophagales bacterium]|nr:DUF4230 domain-containing protein [Cytophaga sp.]